MTTLTPNARASHDAIARDPRMQGPCPRHISGEFLTRHGDPTTLCPDCHGIGKVPLLLEECPAHRLGASCQASSSIETGVIPIHGLCHGTGLVPKPFDALDVLTALAAVGIRLSLGWGIDKAGKWMPSWGWPDRFVMATGISAAANAAALLSATRQALEVDHGR